MPSIKNVSGEDRVAKGRLVLRDADLEVGVDEVYSYTCQESNWAPADDEAKAAHDAAVAALQPADQPKGNASREEWAAYVLGADLATEDDIKDMSRDEMRDTYGQEG